ncbi:hypothetical protein SH83_07225 [Lactiplantibacillus plantarum]|uniref:hypothetical protein n=1 Tax=Lactiplantibacillus plantarum TaxID=1590 RepID=UPI0005BEF276|nr:hypothetical protein [Lactiplantibacillus plantarum]MCS6091411.1 hypothetical protein [Lactobacillus sp. LMY-20]AJO74140.1 hypothetical protein SH83_07225 [Lactiplantibacillus plantarum]ARK34271.1 hypothetical protein B5726_07535 [Lactiplantibacillus plantarum]KAB1956412.1 hypothetical protein F8276_01950 [Lactiplantibacillus plantarum]KKX44718.1 hypothetical protein WH27_02070 [Lactiplantibacillus plantarum]
MIRNQSDNDEKEVELLVTGYVAQNSLIRKVNFGQQCRLFKRAYSADCVMADVRRDTFMNFIVAQSYSWPVGPVSARCPQTDEFGLRVGRAEFPTPNML